MRVLKNADIQTIATTDLTELNYIVPPNIVATAFLVITNNAGSINTFDVYINNGTSDFLIAKRSIPAGIGKAWRVFELSDERLNEGFTIKVQASSATSYNVFLSVSEVN